MPTPQSGWTFNEMMRYPCPSVELEGWVGSKSQFKEAQWGQNETVLEKLAEELVNLCSGLVL